MTVWLCAGGNELGEKGNLIEEKAEKIPGAEPLNEERTGSGVGYTVQTLVGRMMLLWEFVALTF